MDYIIENSFLRVTVRSLGAELVSVVDKETDTEMLWQADTEHWNRYAPMLFPYCGKLKDGKFTYKDVTCEGVQHGFARDMEHAPVAREADSITLCLEANALTMEKFPFAFKLYVTFSLQGRTVRHALGVVNDSDDAMPFGLGYHPGFNCPFDSVHTAEDYTFRFDTPETPIVIACSEVSGLVTGKTYPYFENETDVPLTTHLFDHDSICFSQLKSKTLSLVEKDTGRRITMGIENFPYVLIWAPKGEVHFVCMEPWLSLPDAENADGNWLHKPAAATLEPGARFDTYLDMEFAR